MTRLVYLSTIGAHLASGTGLFRQGPLGLSDRHCNGAASEELEALAGTQPGARKVRYLASEELSGPEVARNLGQAVGEPDLKWVTIPDEQLKDGMMVAGMPSAIAAAMVEIQVRQGSGRLSEDHKRHRPVLGRLKLAEFAKNFAAAYHKP